VGRKLVMRLPVENQNSVSLSINDTEVQDALKLVDDVLVSDGFKREQDPNDLGTQDFVAGYSKLDSEGLRRLGEMARVYFKTNMLEVVFLEGRHPSADVRMSANRVLDLLKNKLSNRYGSDRVKVVTIKY
jgi:hypothetical protein